MNMEEPNECPLILESESLGFFFHRKDLVILMYESESLSYEIKKS